jgi:HECT-domain (ubiquitin-transferase)
LQQQRQRQGSLSDDYISPDEDARGIDVKISKPFNISASAQNALLNPSESHEQDDYNNTNSNNNHNNNNSNDASEKNYSHAISKPFNVKAELVLNTHHLNDDNDDDDDGDDDIVISKPFKVSATVMPAYSDVFSSTSVSSIRDDHDDDSDYKNVVISKPFNVKAELTSQEHPDIDVVISKPFKVSATVATAPAALPLQIHMEEFSSSSQSLFSLHHHTHTRTYYNSHSRRRVRSGIRKQKRQKKSTIKIAQKITVDLKPNGRHVAVTNANKMKYVELITNHKLAGNSTKKQSQALADALHSFVSQELLLLFDSDELLSMMTGAGGEAIDISDWKAHTSYSGATASSAIIQWFWEIIEHDFSEENRRGLLQFATNPLDRQCFFTFHCVCLHRK